jgi:branched-chain amino acid transport system permease protein
VSARDRLVRVLVAALGAAAVSWPLVGFTATEAGGARFALVPSLQIGLVVLVLGTVYAAGLEAFARIPAGPLRAARTAAGKPAVAGTAGLLLLAFLAALPLFATGSWTSNVLEAMVFATIAIGLNISMGMAGLLVLGHAAFWGVGAYTFSLLVIRLEWNFWPSFLAGGAVAAAAGLLLGIPAIRLRGDYLAIVTLGFGEAVKWFLKNESRLSGGDMGIPCSEIPGSFLRPNGRLGEWLWQPTTMAGCYWFALGLLIACVACVTLFTRSRFGRALFALREDETAAKCMGVDTVKVKLIAFTASAFWAGLAGAVHPVFRGQITPDLFDFNASVLFVAMVVLGGLGSIPGSIAGAAVLFILPNLLRDKLPAVQDYRMLIFGAVMAAMMVVKPEGLLGARRTEEPAEAEAAP